MKYIILYLLYFISWNLSSQNLYLKIEGKNQYDNTIIDSISYQKKHVNKATIDDEFAKFKNKIIKSGFIDTKLISIKTNTDSIYQYNIDIGKKIEKIHIYLKNINDLIRLTIITNIKNDTIKIKYDQIESFLNKCTADLEQKGYSLSKVNLKNIKKTSNYLQADLNVVLDKKRTFSQIVIKGYDKFPEGFKKQINKKYRKTVFNKDNLQNIYSDFNKIRFIKQTKYPEILFKIDTTEIYVNVEKAKRNTFDGFIGFVNDANKNVIFNGYVDLSLSNALNSGEKLDLNWKSDGKNQKTFNIGAEVPYIFKSPIGIKASLNIFKQDSIFQNTKTNIELGYALNFNSKIYLGYQETESNDINNLNTATLSDSKNSFVTSSYEYNNFRNEDLLFPIKSNVNFKLGSGQRSAKTQNDKQFFINLNITQHFYFDKKLALSLKSQNYYLNSNNYLTNEQFRFGGINSIRGFNENSLQGNTFLSLLTEFQYIVSNTLYFHSVLDFGYYDDKAVKKSDKLLGLGFGFGIINKNGLLKFIYSNGSLTNQAVKFSNSIVQISLTTSF